MVVLLVPFVAGALVLRAITDRVLSDRPAQRDQVGTVVLGLPFAAFFVIAAIEARPFAVVLAIVLCVFVALRPLLPPNGR